MSNLQTSKKIHLWFYPKYYNQEQITLEEANWASSLPPKRKKEYIFSRGYLRKSLSKLFNLDPIEIPIKARPGEAPKLKKGFGHVSLSHCKDAILIGWYKNKLGVDIERKDRKPNKLLLDKYIFNDIKINKFNKNFLKNNYCILGWCIKESAIKWEQSSLLTNIKNWTIEKDFNSINNKISKNKLNIKYIDHKKWVITCAYK